MKLRTVKIFTLLLVFASFTFGQQSPSALKTAASEFDASKVQTVEYCELMQKPEDYVGKSIRLEAVFKNLASLETILYVECKPKLPAVSVSLADDNFDILSADVLRKLKIKKIDGAKVTVVGRFLGVGKPDSKLNNGLDGRSNYLFEIHAVEKAEAVSEKK